MPEDVLQLVLADGPTTFAGLEQALEEGLVDKVGFTGSTAVGRSIGELAGRHLQSACLELGGKNPLVVMPDADLDLAVQGSLFSGFGTSGQRCTSLGTAWAHRDVYDAFRDAFVAAVESAVVGDPYEKVLYGPMLSERYLDNHVRNLDLVADHHTVHGSTGIGRITSANPRAGFVGDPDKGVYAHPTIVEGIRPGDALYDTETFGPLVGLGVFDSFDEAVELASGHGYGLSAAIYTGDAKQAFDYRAPGRCGDGLGQQLDVRRGGAPAVRRQRALGQRVAAVGHLGARPVHPLAVDELGRQRQAAEGADGHPRAAVRPRVPARMSDLPATAGVVVVGGGVMGVSTAFHLAEAGVRDVLLLDRGALGAGSTSKAAGGVRAQFADELNIRLGKRSLDLFADFLQRPGQEIDLHRTGYLFALTRPEDVAAMEKSVALQNSLGVPSRLIDAAEAASISPLMRTDDVLAAAWSPDDGHCSPDSVVLGYAGAAKRLGATIRTGVEVLSVETSGGEITVGGHRRRHRGDLDGGLLRRRLVARAGRDRGGGPSGHAVPPAGRRDRADAGPAAGRADDDRLRDVVLLPPRGARPACRDVRPRRAAGLLDARRRRLPRADRCGGRGPRPGRPRGRASPTGGPGSTR